MAPQSETVTVLGLGAMGHGMASIALRADIEGASDDEDPGETR